MIRRLWTWLGEGGKYSFFTIAALFFFAAGQVRPCLGTWEHDRIPEREHFTVLFYDVAFVASFFAGCTATEGDCDAAAVRDGNHKSDWVGDVNMIADPSTYVNAFVNAFLCT